MSRGHKNMILRMMMEEKEDDDIEDAGQIQDRAARFLRACAVHMHVNMHKSHFKWKFTRKRLRHRTEAQTWCEPAQLKCTSICHKSHNLQATVPLPCWFLKPAQNQKKKRRERHGQGT